MFNIFLKGFRKGLSDTYHNNKAKCDLRGGAVLKYIFFVSFLKGFRKALSIL